MRLFLALSLGFFCFQHNVYAQEYFDHEAEFDSEYDLQCAMGAEYEFFEQFSCVKATTRQKQVVRQGIAKKSKLFTRCLNQTSQSIWCEQILRPNPASLSRFRCTYGSDMPHFLVHSSESTWKHPIEAVKIINELERKGIRVCQIYNWWRPEPYNKNVGGSAIRHPFGGSIDVRFCSKSDQAKAFNELCKMRKRGRVRAIGYYSSPSLHFGIGDGKANTWGRACP